MNRSFLGAASLMMGMGAMDGFRASHNPNNSIWSRVSNNLARTQPHLSEANRGALCAQIVQGLRGTPVKIPPSRSFKKRR